MGKTLRPQLHRTTIVLKTLSFVNYGFCLFHSRAKLKNQQQHKQKEERPTSQIAPQAALTRCNRQMCICEATQDTNAERLQLTCQSHNPNDF